MAYCKPRRYCPILNCVNYSGTTTESGVAFFQAPRPAIRRPRPADAKNSKIRNQWIQSIRSHQEYDATGISIQLCQLHFDPECIVKGKNGLELVKGTLPTIFPERIRPIENQVQTGTSPSLDTGSYITNHESSQVGPKEPTLSRKPSRGLNLKLMKCKRCLQVGLQLTETNTRLYRLKEKLQKKEKKVQALQDKLNYASSQLVPLRIEDSSFVNQNYIPQRILKKTGIDPLAPPDVASSEAVTNSADRPNVQPDRITVQVDETDELNSDETSTDSNEDADDDTDLPVCERQQFVQYVMDTIVNLPEKSAIRAIEAIGIFLQTWPGYSDTK